MRELRQLKASETFTVATLKGIYEIAKESDKTVTFYSQAKAKNHPK